MTSGNPGRDGGQAVQSRRWALEREGYTLEGTLWLPQEEEKGFFASFAGRFRRKPLVIMHHGLVANRRYLGKYARYLASHGFITMAYDARGHGKTGGELSVPAMVDDLEAVVESLSEQYHPKAIGLIGHSMGGWVSTMAASRCEDVDAVVSIAGAVDPVNDFVGMYPPLRCIPDLLFPLVRWMDENKKDIHLPSALINEGVLERQGVEAMRFLLCGDPAPDENIPALVDSSIRSLCRTFMSWPDAKEYAPGMKAAYLGIHGTRDMVVPFTAGAALYSCVGSASKEFYPLKGGGHMINYTHFEVIAPKMLEFFDEYLR